MELKEETGVVTSAGQHVGRINRFVLHPGINELTNIVVQKGWPPMETVRNILACTIPHQEGMDVIGADGEQVDESNLWETHFVVSAGTLFTGQKLIPTPWLKSLQENQVHHSVPSQLLERLPDYLPE